MCCTLQRFDWLAFRRKPNTSWPRLTCISARMEGLLSILPYSCFWRRGFFKIIIGKRGLVLLFFAEKFFSLRTSIPQGSNFTLNNNNIINNWLSKKDDLAEVKPLEFEWEAKKKYVQLKLQFICWAISIVVSSEGINTFACSHWSSNSNKRYPRSVSSSNATWKSNNDFWKLITITIIKILLKHQIISLQKKYWRLNKEKYRTDNTTTFGNFLACPIYWRNGRCQKPSPRSQGCCTG